MQGCRVYCGPVLIMRYVATIDHCLWAKCDFATRVLDIMLYSWLWRLVVSEGSYLCMSVAVVMCKT